MPLCVEGPPLFKNTFGGSPLVLCFYLVVWMFFFAYVHWYTHLRINLKLENFVWRWHMKTFDSDFAKSFISAMGCVDLVVSRFASATRWNLTGEYFKVFKPRGIMRKLQTSCLHVENEISETRLWRTLNQPLFHSVIRTKQMSEWHNWNKTGTSKVGAISEAQKDWSYASSSVKRKLLRI